MKTAIVTAILKFLKGGILQMLALYLAKLQGRREVLAEQAKKDAEKQKEYAKISAEHRTVDDLVKQLRSKDGSF